MLKKTLYQVQELKSDNTWKVIYTYLVKVNAEWIVNMLTQRFPTREFKIVEIESQKIVEVKPQEEI